MSDSTQISTIIDPTIKAMLHRMRKEDLRTFRGQLEWLITQEHQRRQAPANTLVDAPVGYHDVEKFYRDEEPVQ